MQIIEAALAKHFIFSGLRPQDKHIIMNHILQYTIPPYKTIFKQGDSGSSFFIIGSGSVEVIVNEQRVKVLRSGSSFGELALLHDSPRTATIQSLDNCVLWGLDRATFRNVLKSINS